MNRTKIEWAKNPDDSLGWSSNPVKGLCPMHCKTPDGYEYCYAAGERGLYQRFKWDQTIRFDSSEIGQACRAKPGNKIFVGSTIDLFHPDIKRDWVETILLDAARFPQITFVFLTKCPENLTRWSPFPENCCVGVTATDFESLAHGLYTGLPRVRASVKFISLEPLFGQTKLTSSDLIDSGVGWVIIGALTGPKARQYKPRPEWVREIIDAADGANVPVFIKDNLRWPVQRREWPGAQTLLLLNPRTDLI